MTIDVGAVRADTPAVDRIIHLNNAGSSLSPMPVLEATIEYLRAEAETGGYEIAAERSDDLDHVYVAGAQLLRCATTEVAFAGSASLAWWRAWESVPLVAGDRVLISTTEFQANAFAFMQAAQRGIEIELVPATESGEIDLDALTSMLDERVKIVSLTQISMSNGMVQPAAEVGALVQETDALYLLDACQAAGQLPLDVEELGCDFLCFTGRKFLRGPRGTGLLFVREGVMDQLRPPGSIDGRAALWNDDNTYALQPSALRFETGEVPHASKVGFGVAMQYALDLGIDQIEERIAKLSTHFRAGLSAINGIEVTDQGERQCGIVTFTVGGINPLEVATRLRSQHINVSAPGRANAQHDLGRRGIEAVVRAGVHYFNTVAELDRTLEELAGIAP